MIDQKNSLKRDFYAEICRVPQCNRSIYDFKRALRQTPLLKKQIKVIEELTRIYKMIIIIKAPKNGIIDDEFITI
ncbi:hypothetical protein DSCOOX_25660 [Desulfosarcina ovata subsp. ovata]|uniref:Uncharacterized protein n=1 Tax=Desulfosarcina ovata subsp. ovata TaxID=2752305 RepID=A0A5K8AA63_9BACT|nr:hypothetical protein DSCOOX_25660 [Desulfosarcina ovata subsp. ovata]